MVENLIGLALFSVLVEAVVNVLKDVKDGHKVNTTLLMSLAVSLIATVGFNIDIFSMVGFETSIPFLGAVMSGVIVSRGSNYTSDLITRLKEGTKEE